MSDNIFGLNKTNGFDVILSAGTAVEVIISGAKLNGVLKDATGASYPISGAGDADYVYNNGGDGWHADVGSLTTAPLFIPGKVLEYQPNPGSRGSLTVESSGTISTSPSNPNKKGTNVPLKGRILPFRVEITAEAPIDCTLPDLGQFNQSNVCDNPDGSLQASCPGDSGCSQAVCDEFIALVQSMFGC